VVTIGAYDGVHLGHRAVIDRVVDLAAARSLRPVVVTFDRHPASVVRPEAAPLLLTDLDQKLELLAETGIAATLVVRFTPERGRERAREFVERVLVGCLGAKVIVVGEDFHFGANREGNVAVLGELGDELGFGVEAQELVPPASPAPTTPGGSVGLEKISSTAIREALRAGDLAGAEAMLGRHHEVRGVVGHGDKRARDLGYPTANVEVPPDICLPADGIYAAWYLDAQGRQYPAAVSLGRRPTFYADQPYSLLEAHLLGVDDISLYDELARVRFVARLRDEERFDTVGDLVAQMERDCSAAAEALGVQPAP
jgi:riboflavin kinase/FMN adenylyltransferase